LRKWTRPANVRRRLSFFWRQDKRTPSGCATPSVRWKKEKKKKRKKEKKKKRKKEKGEENKEERGKEEKKESRRTRMTTGGGIDRDDERVIALRWLSRMRG